MNLKSPQTNSTPSSGQPFLAAALGIVAGYAGILTILFIQHKWILAPAGKPIASDFIAYWTAGRTALSGHATDAYDIAAQNAMQTHLAGPFQGYYYWNYPPAFFFIVALLGCLPFLGAFMLWVTTTGAAFTLTIGKITARREAILCVCASPAVLINAYVGQGGFLTAFLLGAGLVALPRRPILGGFLFGLMAYKPQFGILIPLVLLATVNWRAILSAASTILATSVAAALAFGTSSYTAFFRALPVLSKATLTLGSEDRSRVQSFYSIARFARAGDGTAWMVQVAVILICAVALVWLWRRDVSYALKAAALVAATMLSTPYLHEYDFPVLLIAFAFLYCECPFDRADWIIVGAANLLMGAFLAQLAPIGPFIILLVGAMIVRRLMHLSRPAASFDDDNGRRPADLLLQN